MPLMVPTISLETLFPEKSFLASRTTMDVLGRVHADHFRLDTVTGNTLTLCGGMPVICSSRVASPLILDFFAMAGLETGSRLLTYENLEEAMALAKDLIKEGWRLVYTYPPPEGLRESDGLVVPVHLYSWLNDKENIDCLVDQRYLPPHVFVSVGDVEHIQTAFPGKPVFVKGCMDRVTGGGRDVFFCGEPGKGDAVLDWMKNRPEGFSRLRVEEAMEIETSWCINLAIGEKESRYLGAAVQLFSQPAKQQGNRIGPDAPLPDLARSIALSVAEKARALGYRGIAGFDAGITSDGRPFFFDLNFRFVASTPLVSLYRLAEKRFGPCVAETWDKSVKGPLGPALNCLASFVKKGDFLPYRLYEGTALSEWKSIVTGVILGGSLSEVEEKKSAIEAGLCDLIEEA